MKKLSVFLVFAWLFVACGEEEQSQVPLCGDQICQEGENTSNCAKDCPADRCGDGQCSAAEDAASCPADCTLESCGNSVCDDGETGTNCPADCGEEVACGDAVCEGDEDAANCPADCGLETCGNSVCDAGETGTNCPADCGEEAACGDAVCEGDEDAANCPADCAIETCGNSVCDEGETSSNCPADCGEEAICGDSLCEGDEDVDNCPADCAEGEGEQRCEDQVDNDGDGYVDCDDYDCRWSQVELCGAEATDELCNDGVDNDGDGYNDCQDHDCSRNPNVTVCHGGTSSEENTNEACSDHIDNDMDGHYDCDDHDCSQNSSVTVCSSTQANERVTKYHAADIDYGFQEMVVSGVYDSIVDTVPWGCVAQEPGNDSLIWRIKNGEENAIVFTFSLPDAPLLEPALYFYEASFCENCDDFLPTYSYMSFKLNGVDFYSEMLWECPGETNFGAELNDFLHPGLNTIEVFSNPDTELLHGLQGVHLEYEYCTNGSGC